jgi:hypothetical protein
MVMEVPSFVRIFRPRSEAGQDGMIRKECGNIIPPTEQGRGRVLYGQKGEPSIPTTEIDEVGRQQRIGSPHVQEEGDGLTCYLEHDSGLGEGDWGH